nr:MAG TPA: hypothetical protein [Caudoviricetes sp.]
MWTRRRRARLSCRYSNMNNLKCSVLDTPLNP